MKSEGTRSYSSPLRAEQTAATRARILDAAIDLLRATDSATSPSPTSPSGPEVSVRTAYRAFPSRDDLLEGVLAELSLRFEAIAGTIPTTLDEYVASVEGSARRVRSRAPLPGTVRHARRP